MKQYATALSLGLLTSFSIPLIATDEARAACTPAAGDGVSASCTDTTAGNPYGYGDDLLTDLTVTVAPGASVTGTNSGLRFSTGHAVNFGTITGTNQGIRLGSGTVENNGRVEATAGIGIWADLEVNVTNSGSVQGTVYGVVGLTQLNLTNSGSIVGLTARGAGSNGSATVVNSGTIQGGVDGVLGLTQLNLTNSGSIVGLTGWGAGSNVSATVTNSGSIVGYNFGVQSIDVATVNNSGTITATGITGAAVNAGTLRLDNSGTLIATGASGIGARGWTIDVVNSGTIIGDIGAASVAGGGALPSHIVNSGTIIGNSGTAIQFNNGVSGDSLTVLPGARFGGLVDFGGGADRVTFGPGSWILNTANFDAAQSTVTTAGGAHFVEPNRIVVADLSGFGAMNRAVMDITGWIASVLPEVPVVEPMGRPDGAANAFAAIEQGGDLGGSRIDDAFASLPVTATAYAPVFKAGTVIDRDGNSVWAKGFGGRRSQPTGDNAIGSVTSGFGGAFGYERLFASGIKVGGFVGASTNRTDQALNAGKIDTNAAFAGLYSRMLYGASFLDLALIGGTLDNESRRNIGGGLALETARASYGGWFVNPSLAIGHSFALDGITTLTPALKLRYVAAHFNGYTETGSSANLAVVGRDVQTLEERAELTLAKVFRLGSAQRLVTRLSGGVLAQQRVGDRNVDIALAGQNFIGATPERGSVTGGYGGIGVDWQSGRTILFASGEVVALDDSTTSFAGKGGLRVLW